MTLIQPADSVMKDTPMAPYDPMAPHYEAFVGDADVMRYPEWLAGLIGLAAEHGARPGRALDVGCGTGRSLEALRLAGFEAAGVDPSRGMMEIARERLGEDIELQVGGLPDLPPGPPVDLVTAFNDIINCVGATELDAAIAALANRLRPGGLLLFDANAPLTFSTFFGTTFCRGDEGLFLVWESLGHGDDGDYRADLHAFQIDRETGHWERSVSHHVQHHHPHDRVIAALTAAGLELLLTQGQRDGGPRDPFFDEEIHTKRIYLARFP